MIPRPLGGRKTRTETFIRQLSLLAREDNPEVFDMTRERFQQPSPAQDPARYQPYDSRVYGNPTVSQSYPSAGGMNQEVATSASKSIDGIVAAGRLAVPGADPILALATDRMLTSFLSLDDAIGQVRRRYDIYARHVDEIEQSRLRMVNASTSWRQPPFWIPEEDDPEVREAVDRLEQQKREERLSLWRDVSRLRQTIPQSAQEYLGACRRTQIIEYGGDAF